MKFLKKVVQNIRKNIIVLTHQAKSSHIGSCLSIVEILTYLYFRVIKKNRQDRFILSKGHGTLALYCVLHEKKILNKKILFSYGKNNSLLMGHASHHVPGIIFSTGSLGHGLPVAVGLALSSKIKKKPKKIYVLLSDGELNEGSVWEALMFASHHNLDNLCVIVDYNKIQSLTSVKNTIKINGHNFSHFKRAFKSSAIRKPKVIIANTVKGKGVSFMENKISWHYKSPNKRELDLALREIDNA